jgi:hypothetical protein
LAAVVVPSAGLETIGLVTAGFAAVGFGGAALAGGAVLVGVVPLLETGFTEAGLTMADGTALGITLEGTDDAAGRLEKALLACWLSGLEGRGSWASALRFIPVLAFPAAWGARGAAPTRRSSFFTVEDEVGTAGG